MKTLLSALAVAGTLIIGASHPASAQGIEFRLGDPAPRVERRIIERRGSDDGYGRGGYDGPRRGVVEERIIRRPARERTVCRTEVRERIRRDGAYVRKPVEVCRTIRG